MKVIFGRSDPWTHEKWTIELDIEAFCKLEGVIYLDPQTDKKVTAYPMTKVRKVFTLMVQTMRQDELDVIHDFLKCKSKKYADVFQQIRQKGR